MEQGYDASSKVDALAATLKVTYKGVSMGSAEGYDMAEKAITTGAKEGILRLSYCNLCLPLITISMIRHLGPTS